MYINHLMYRSPNWVLTSSLWCAFQIAPCEEDSSHQEEKSNKPQSPQDDVPVCGDSDRVHPDKHRSSGKTPAQTEN